MRTQSTSFIRWNACFWALCFLASSLSLWACERQVQTCQTDKDCKAGERCISQACTPQNDGGTEKTPLPDGSEPILSSEIPPWPDQTWPEPTFERPDRLVPPENATPVKGTRKDGETCDPTQTALAEDRCSDGLLCVYGSVTSAGICQKSCDPAAPACGSGQQCASVIGPDINQVIGHACVPESQDGEPCMHGLACPSTHACIRVSETNTGVCLKKCNAAADCASGGAQGYCGSVTLYEDAGQTVTACILQAAGAGSPCSGPRLCGAGLRCLGDSERKLCRKGCDGGAACGQGEVCVAYRNTNGQVVYSLCLPERLEKESCDATNRCAQGLSCVALANKARVCLKDCKADDKVCDAQTEVCQAWGTSSKACFLKDAPLGSSCDGGVLCAQGLSCLGESPVGPFFCLPPCSQDADCTSGQTCQRLGISGSLFCTPSCVNTSCPAPLACGNTHCFPVQDKPGEKAQNEVCTLSPLAPPAERCGQGLRCITTGDQGRCLRPCDPNAPAPCPGPIACTWLDSEKAHFCGAASTTTCDLSQSTFCSNDTRCLRKIFSESGRCQKLPQQPLDAYCLDQNLPCASNLRCAGDPLTYYRWRCRTPCDSKGASCPNGQTCLNLGQGQACFAPCTNNACTSTSLTCQEAQGQAICL
ncbi:MAG: hypothetical protein H6727_09440 [Myxococcales bacterium]|nr:hypothetical protein [Myxococcales bacterium]